MSTLNHQTPERPGDPSDTVSAREIKGLFQAILGAPFGKPLLAAAQMLESSDPKPDLNQIVGFIEEVKNEYTMRSACVLSGDDETSAARVRENLQQFKTVLDRLNATIRDRATQPTPSTATTFTQDEMRVEQNTAVLAGSSSLSASVQLAVGDFGTVIQLVSAVRLSQKGNVVVNLSDVAAGLNSARRELEVGHLDESVKSVQKLCNTNDKKIRSWENLARQREAQSATMSMAERDKMRAEHNGVRNRYRMAQTQFRRLLTVLEDLHKPRE